MDARPPPAASARQDRERAHWQKWQAKADEIWGWQTPAGQARADRRARLFLERARMTKESVVLEIGCGTGQFTGRIAPHVRELWATDISPDLLERAKARLREAGADRNVRLEIQDAMQLTLDANHFDAAFGCSVLHHLDAGKALRELRRVLKPGGWCVFSEPNMLNPQIALQKNVGFIKRRAGDTPDETAFFRGEMRLLLQAAGFVEIEVRPFDFLHPLTPRTWIGAVARLGEWFERLPLVRAIAGSLLISARKPEAGSATV